MLSDPGSWKEVDPDEKMRQKVQARCQPKGHEGMKRTVVVMLVRAVGITPLWKDSAVFCMATSCVLSWGGLEVCGDGVAGYMAVCRSGVRTPHFRDGW